VSLVGFGGLIQAAVGSGGGCGGWRTSARDGRPEQHPTPGSARRTGLRPTIMDHSGGSKPSPACRCAVLYQQKNSWQKVRASSIEAKPVGEAGPVLERLELRLRVGIVMETCGRE